MCGCGGLFCLGYEGLPHRSSEWVYCQLGVGVPTVRQMRAASPSNDIHKTREEGTRVTRGGVL